VAVEVSAGAVGGLDVHVLSSAEGGWRGAASTGRDNVMNLPRTGSGNQLTDRVLKAHSAFIDGLQSRVLKCQEHTANYVDKAVDQAVHTHASLKSQWADDAVGR
jgi:hypothetical protein